MIKHSILVLLSVLLLFSCNSSDKTQTQPIATNNDKQVNLSFRSSIIGIKQVNDSVQFYDKSTDQHFIPKGYNYTHVQEVSYQDVSFLSHSTFSSQYYDSKVTDQVLSTLKDNGFNTIRVFLNPALISHHRGSLNQEYMVNVADFIIKADEYHLSVIITTDLAPIAYYNKEIQSEADITWLNTQYINQEEIAIEAFYWRTLINELRSYSVPLHAILSYEIRNEFFFNPNLPPFKNNDEIITHPNGVVYDLSNEIERNALINASFLYWSSTIRNAIVEEEPNALVSVGFFAPEPLGKPSTVAMMESELDFIDLHMYPTTASMTEYAQYFNLATQSNKPLIMGEFGYVEKSHLTINEIANNLFSWKETAMLDHKMAGWLLWSWDTKIGSPLSVSDDNNIIFKHLSPIKTQ